MSITINGTKFKKHVDYDIIDERQEDNLFAGQIYYLTINEVHLDSKLCEILSDAFRNQQRLKISISRGFYKIKSKMIVVHYNVCSESRKKPVACFILKSTKVSTYKKKNVRKIKKMSGLEMKYFVLKPQSKKPTDPYALASRIAMKAYANEIKNENPELASSLRKWAILETKHETKT
jgi:hypothetical protein